MLPALAPLVCCTNGLLFVVDARMKGPVVVAVGMEEAVCKPVLMAPIVPVQATP